MARMILDKEFYSIMTDMATNKLPESKKEKAPDIIKNKLIEAFGDKEITHRMWKRNEDLVYELIEETFPVSIVNAWETNPFFNATAEIKNGSEGQKNLFTVKEANDLIVSKFAGNTWSTERQFIGGMNEFSLPVEWFTVRVFEEIRRVLTDVTSVSDMYTAIDTSLIKDLTSRIYTSFAASSEKIPTRFKESGSFVKDTMLDLIERVQIATGKDVQIFGCRQALAKMWDGVGANWISESARDERNKTGFVRYWEGFTSIEIPNAFKKGTYDFAFTPNTLYIMTNDKPIKVYYEGTPRMRMLDYTETTDQTVDIETQVCMGHGVAFSDVYGIYTIN